jgi:23S rRNA (adenine-N6)-dimethyltransferase
LRNQFDQRDVTVVRADGPDLRLPRRPFKVVSNPPFGITTSLVKRLVRADLACRGMPRSAGARKTLPAEDAGTVTSWSISVGRHLGRRFVHHRRTTSLCS